MLKIGEIYRMPHPQQKDIAVVDGLPNFYYESNVENRGFEFQRGIHSVAPVSTVNGEKRCPLLIVSSTPRKAGQEDTPWLDIYDHDHGYVKYFGDNKSSDTSPESKGGNKTLLNLLKYYDSQDRETRMKNAVPIIFFEKCSFEGRVKGNAIFHGFGILESVELVTQYNKDQSYFANYKFSFVIFSLSSENEKFDWRWIKDRCDPSKSSEETLRYAPKSWIKWINAGNEVLHLVRRSVSNLGLVKSSQQKPKNKKLLEQIYKFYDNKKHDFEYLAMDVTVKCIEESGADCVTGWITKKSGDGGVDYVLRIDIGKEKLSSVKIIVLGQAKCTDPNKPTNGKDIARTVARIKRGWIGAYVTTSYFSESVQKEVKEDSYPIMLINGAKITDIVSKELFESKLSLEEYLTSLKYKYRESFNIPEDILDK